MIVVRMIVVRCLALALASACLALAKHGKLSKTCPGVPELDDDID